MKGMNKKGSAMVAIWILVVAVVGGFAYMTSGFGLLKDTEETQAAVETTAKASKTGKVATLKVSVLDSQDNPTRYAGTAYCWNVLKPTELLGGGSVTLSATAGTSVTPANVGDSITCIAFDSTHYGVPKTKKIEIESEQLTLASINASGTAAEYYVEFYESGTKETDTATLSIAAGATKTFNKWIFYSNYSDRGINLKAACIASNATASSQLDSIELGGWTRVNTRPYRYRNSHSTCFELAEAQYIEDYNSIEFGAIKIGMSNDFSNQETFNITLIDEAHYQSVDQSIQEGIEDDTVSPADVGMADLQAQFNVSVG